MAEITRGKHRGKKCLVHQWANDWFSVQVGGEAAIVNILSVRLTRKEMGWVRRSQELERCGVMFDVFRLEEDGTFSRVRTFSPPREKKPRPSDPLPDGTPVSREVVNARRRILRKLRVVDDTPLKFGKRQTREQRENDQGTITDINRK